MYKKPMPKYILIQIPPSQKMNLLTHHPEFPTIDIEAIISHTLYCFYENSDYQGFKTGDVQNYICNEVMESIFDDMMSDEQALQLSDDPRMSPIGTLLVNTLDDFIREIVESAHRVFQSLNILDYENFHYVFRGFLPGTNDTLILYNEY